MRALISLITCIVGISALSAIGQSLNSDALPEGEHGIATRFPEDRGIDADFGVLLHDDFETGSALRPSE